MGGYIHLPFATVEGRGRSFHHYQVLIIIFQEKGGELIDFLDEQVSRRVVAEQTGAGEVKANNVSVENILRASGLCDCRTICVYRVPIVALTNQLLKSSGTSTGDW